MAYEDSTPEERDYAAALASFPNISWKGHCMYCGHCLPCPARISIADVTKFLNLALAQGGVPETVREHYKVLEHHAGECLQFLEAFRKKFIDFCHIIFCLLY